MGETKNVYALSVQARAVAALATRMRPAEAEPLTANATRRVLEAMERDPSNFNTDALSEAAQALAPRMGPADSAEAARTALRRMEANSYPPIVRAWGWRWRPLPFRRTRR